ncbi:transducin-like enhancer protein 4 isoform X1 [Ictalurus punctatus]|uniref:Transducin-like enhancer protein 4 isoform X1 n=1 Tax=Ictalurus punctatus TaxID=7998 RepID=A0A2D0T8K9_ICTPU|nr:transducin-like enhancer protein 4 isoform X1 [Ictalurus punctatus]XP_017351220.1 transducin-like enhancer protein 4 isoform X1 [Ictalurus punctatus]XP_053507323.1 transducin-like enhancer protein 4 isoform X1 [Ictalurus furcatus]
MYPHGRPQAPLVPGHVGMKFTVLETLDHIKEEFQLFQAQYHSLKLECEKLATEKTEMHRHYIMYYEMSYGLNIEMQKQAEIVKRLSAICTQIIPLLSQEHQHQVAQAVERSKHVSMADLNAIIGQQQLQHLSHHAPGFPLTPHQSGLSLGAGVGLMALPGAFPFPPHLVPKDDVTHPESVDPRDGAPNRSFADSALVSQSVAQRLPLPLGCPAESASDSKRSSAEGKPRVPTPRDREVEKNEDSLKRDSTKEKNMSPAGGSPRSADGNGVDSRNSSRDARSPSSGFPHTHTPNQHKSPPQEKSRSRSPSPSRDAPSPAPPPPPTACPLSSPACAPSPPVQH